MLKFYFAPAIYFRIIYSQLRSQPFAKYLLTLINNNIIAVCKVDGSTPAVSIHKGEQYYSGI